MQITRGKIAGAQKCVVYGPEGIGKSTLASKFPNPLFIDTEGSTKHMDVARTPKPSSWNMLLSQVTWIRSNSAVCDTLVVDTADWAEILCTEHICTKHQKNGIEDFGYGKGYVYLEEEFGKLLNALNDLIEIGINVVLTAHAQMRKFEQPDETGSYDRWELKLEKKTAPLVREWADMMLFANYKTYVVNVDGQGAAKGKNKAQGGKRILYTQHHPCWDAKNRHDLPAEIDMDYAAIAHCIPQRGGAPQPAKPTTPQPEQKTLVPEAPVAAAEDESPFGNVPALQSEAIPQTQPADKLDAEGVPKALADLMRAEHVTLDEIHAVIVAKGHFPKNTPFRNYPTDYVDGVLIACWPQVLAAVKEQRDDVPF